MKEAIVSKGPSVKIVDSDIPKPSPTQVLIKVIVSGTNPKDWKYPEWLGKDANTGDDIAGIVEGVGSEVYEFKAGDRVTAFHTMMTPAGSFAEYALSEAHTTAHMPKDLTFEEAATLPLAVLTSAIAMNIDLGLPMPWKPATEKTPFVVYGGASAIGAFAIKLAQLANIHPIITVAGRGTEFVEGLIDRSKGDTIIDYRKGDDAVVQGIKDALGGEELKYAYDCVSEGETYKNIAKVMKGGKISIVLPRQENDGVSDDIEILRSYVGNAHEKDSAFAMVAFRYVLLAVHLGKLKPHPHEVVPGGLNGVEKGLKDLKDGKASAVKYVYRIAET